MFVSLRLPELFNTINAHKCMLCITHTVLILAKSSRNTYLCECPRRCLAGYFHRYLSRDILMKLHNFQMHILPVVLYFWVETHAGLTCLFLAMTVAYCIFTHSKSPLGVLGKHIYSVLISLKNKIFEDVIFFK